MTLHSQDYAQLADHCYDRQGDLTQLVNQNIELGGVEYKVLAVADKPSGYQGAIYQRVDTGEIVVAHRGTEFEREKLQDLVLTDGGMVVNRSNRQADDAIELTRDALQQAQEFASEKGIPAPAVSVTGHSLGGTLAQITAHHFGLKGETFNAYGAASLDRRIPEGGNDVINHVMAHDMVGAGSPQYGQVKVYANTQAIGTLQEFGYDNTRSPLDSRSAPLVAKNALDRGSHDMHNFLPWDGSKRDDVSILADPQARQLAAQYDPMIDKYRADVNRLRGVATFTTRSGPGHLRDAIDDLRGPLEPGEPARREAEALERQLRRWEESAPVLPGPRPGVMDMDPRSVQPAALRRDVDSTSSSLLPTDPARTHLQDPSTRTYADPNLTPPAETQAHALTHMPSDHPDYALFASIRERMPRDVPDAMLAHVALAAKQGQVKPGEVQDLAVLDNVVHIQGRFPGQRASVRLDQDAPPLEETLRNSQAYDQQQARQLAQWQSDEQQINEAYRQEQSGPRMG